MQSNSELTKYLENLFKDKTPDFLNALPEPTSLRVNTLKYTNKNLENLLKSIKIKYKTIDFNPAGYIIEAESQKLSHTLQYFRGQLFFQGVSSQLPVILLDPQKGEKVLDIAAAPGSKSTQIAARMQGSGELVINDYSYKRMQALNTNLQRSGANHFYVLNMFGERFGHLFPEQFDKILVDAPCTALGSLPASRQVASWWSYEKLNKLGYVQYHLLISAIKALKPGGELVYSTCSVAPEENEQIVSKILDKYPVQTLQPPAAITNSFPDNQSDLPNAIRILPHVHGYEGFFAVKLQKIGRTQPSQLKSVNYENLRESTNDKIFPILEKISEQWGIDFRVWSEFMYKLTSKRIWFCSKEIRRIPQIEFKSAGLLLAEHKFGGWKLSHAAVDFFGAEINKRVLELGTDQITQLFDSGLLDFKAEPGYHALSFQGEKFAVIYCEANQLRIRKPHAFKLELE